MQISLLRTFFHTLTQSCGISRGDRIVVAVSGGPDSIALLHLLAGVQQQLQLHLTVVWVDHGLRPEETPQEEAVVCAAAEKMRIPVVRHRVNAAACAAEQRLSLEHAARNLRYAALRATAQEVQAQYIAVAHTADDQAEEILLRLLRGSGRQGLAGMRMQSRDLIRPLLTVGKNELLVWLDKEQVTYCIDSSNNDLLFLRNRVRHQLLPFLEEHFDAGIRKSLRKTAASLAEDENLLAELTAEAERKVVKFVKIVRLDEAEQQEGPTVVQLLRRPFCDLQSALQRRVIEQLLWQLGCRAKYDHILLIIKAALSGRNNSELHLSRGLRVGVFRDRLEFSYPAGKRAWRGRLFRRTEAQEPPDL
ncbi:MAG: tRNA lysidine(34) synthetase TilS [Candidatus Electrothrix sp. YB6]